MSRIRKEYMKIARRITLADLQGGTGDEDLSLNSLVEDGRVRQSSNFFMGIFSATGLKNVIHQFGLSKELQKQGLEDIRIEIDTSDAHTHRFYAYNSSVSDKNKICEMVLKQGPVNIKEGILSNFPHQNPNLLQVEWLMLQNPKRDFDDKRPRLPGQSHPGLGLGDQIMELMIIMTKRLRLEGIVNKPHYFHTAFMFTKEFIFTNPRNQAILDAINKQLLSKYNFYTVAWAAYFDCIINAKTDQPLKWDPDYLILPLKKYLLKYFQSREYQRNVNQQCKNYQFRIDRDNFLAAMTKHNLKVFQDL